MTDVAGDVIVSGSSTVEPISIRVGELISERTDGAVAVTVDGPGTGDGFKLFCAGESRHLRCLAPDQGRGSRDLRRRTGSSSPRSQVAIDGLTVVTSPTNTAVECLDIPALYALLGPESEGLDSWSDAAELAAELGSRTPTCCPTHRSGDLRPRRGDPAPTTRSSSSPSPSSPRIAASDDCAPRRLRRQPERQRDRRGDRRIGHSLGWVGYAYYASQGDEMKAIAIDDGEAAVSPRPSETIADGSYPFSRTLVHLRQQRQRCREPGGAGLRRSLRLGRRLRPGGQGRLRDPAGRGDAGQRRRLDGDGLTSCLRPVLGRAEPHPRLEPDRPPTIRSPSARRTHRKGSLVAVNPAQLSLDDFRGDTRRVRKETVVQFALRGAALLSILISLLIVFVLVRGAYRLPQRTSTGMGDAEGHRLVPPPSTLRPVDDHRRLDRDGDDRDGRRRALRSRHRGLPLGVRRPAGAQHRQADRRGPRRDPVGGRRLLRPQVRRSRDRSSRCSIRPRRATCSPPASGSGSW